MFTQATISTFLGFMLVCSSIQMLPADLSSEPQPTPEESQPAPEPPAECLEEHEGCGCSQYTTVCHDLCTPYSEAGCFLCYTRAYHVGKDGKRVGELDGELVIVCPYEKVECISTC